MASSPSNYLKTPNILISIFSLILILSSNIAGADHHQSLLAKDHIDGKSLKQKKMVLGSKPPECANKCLGCRPCMASLVVSQHEKNVKPLPHAPESYYLLGWKCKCRDKFFQP
ncbi:EPIDERMAL PATTERNING FACTOR-like protein 8 [Humulus lupulus]|uniref:EPIDERMAL PATTERNING FACTOR-like protein 8 n=1 Tax=Humulus lupulus TaxID=3486 RepID=UPI002B404F34|nr:EPIDERMAL PATTERNING FACTOR-like protein 8 [Humulus lupulus]